MFRLKCKNCFKHPRNAVVGPEYDRWFEKYDPWVALNKMRKLAGTGFYVPPDWYQHFRMFPPPHNLASEEHTMNPYAHDPHIKTDFEKNEDRQNLRDALGKASRGAASAGNRYMNIFWIQKPLDEMERTYYSYTGDYGMAHEEAFRRVVSEYYSKQAVGMRIRQIQREEAAMSGKCLSMKDGIALIHTLSFLQKEQLPPQEYATLSDNIKKAHKKHSRRKTIRHIVKKSSVRSTERMLKSKKVQKTSEECHSPTNGAVEHSVADQANLEEAQNDTEEDVQLNEDETEIVDAPASSLENSTFSVARERIARKGSYGSSWYTSFQPDSPGIKPSPAEELNSSLISIGKSTDQSSTSAKSSEAGKPLAGGSLGTQLKHKSPDINPREI